MRRPRKIEDGFSLAYLGLRLVRRWPAGSPCCGAGENNLGPTINTSRGPIVEEQANCMRGH